MEYVKNVDNTIVIVGGGAAGMLSAIYSKTEYNNVIILEQNNKLGKKILITGKGRCNITNIGDVDDHLNNCIHNKKFMYTAYYSYTSNNIIELLNDNGLMTKVERGGRIFPETDKAKDVVLTLEKIIKKRDIKVKLNEKVIDINKIGNKFKVKTDNYEYEADKVIVCTGGSSYKSTGSNGKFFNVIKKMGHNINEIRPALVPFITQEDVSDLAGLTLKNVNFSIYKSKISLFGDMLFTHKGISGPIVLSASSLLDENIKFPLLCSIDLKPALTKEKLDKRLIRELEMQCNKNIDNVMKEVLPLKLINKILNYANIDVHKKANQISKQERLCLVDGIKDYRLHIKSTASLDEAIVTRGGVDTRQIDPHTMESKLIKGLFFAGEVIDVDSLTGGYNLQVAWSSAYLAAISN